MSGPLCVYALVLSLGPRYNDAGYEAPGECLTRTRTMAVVPPAVQLHHSRSLDIDHADPTKPANENHLLLLHLGSV